MKSMKLQFSRYERITEFTRYVSTDNVAIALRDEESGEQVCRATVNIDPLIDAWGAVKNWSEGEGMVEAFLAAGVVDPGIVSFRENGFVKTLFYRVSEAALGAIWEQEMSHA